MTIEELKKAQDAMVDHAKFLINKNGDIRPLSFVLAYHGNLDKLKKIGGQVKILNPEDSDWFRTLKDHDIVVVIRPWVMSWQEMFGILYVDAPEPKRELLKNLLVEAKSYDVEDEFEVVTKALMERLKLTEKDVTAIALRQLCEATEAVAIVNVMTAWGLAPKDLVSRDESLEFNSKSIEILCVSLESQAIERTIIIPIKRRPDKPGKDRGTGKPIGWGERQESSTEDSPEWQAAGRFTHLLKPLQHSEMKS